MRQRIIPYFSKFHGHLFAKILDNIIFAHAFEQHCCLVRSNYALSKPLNLKPSSELLKADLELRT